ncbi:MAG: antitermination protein NusG [Candidatus Thiodiazotropha sp.]
MLVLRPMITKLLVTLGVILAAWWVLRNRQRRIDTVASEPPRIAPPLSGANPWKWGGYLLVLCMILGSGLFLYTEWQDRYRVVTVAVVNSQTGERIEYQARRMDVAERHFVTLDGIEVSVADTERIELQSAPMARH